MGRRVAIVPAAVLVATLVACAVAILVSQSRAEASFPGEKGGVVYSYYRDTSEEPRSLDVRDLSTGEFTRLTDNDATYMVYDVSPAVSPDGTRVVFHRHDYDEPRELSGLYAANTDGTGTDAAGITKIIDSPSMREHSPAWSPDGRKIAFAAYPTTGREGVRNGDTEVYVVDADGTDLRKITDNEVDEGAIDWSPDGSRISFAAYVVEGQFYATDVYVMDADGSGATRLADGSSPSWSPDGSRIAFACGPFSDQAICTMNPDGSDQRRIVTDRFENRPYVEAVYDYSPVWSPDGTRIAFAREIDFGDTAGNSVFTMKTDGSDLKIVAGYFPRADDPAWGPKPGTQPAPTAPPETTIISGPSGTRGPTATFDFVSSSLDSSFECSLDGADFAPCEGPKRYEDLSGGEHTFAVRAENAAGEDQTPDTRRWTVDASPPRGKVVINGGRASTTNRQVFLTLSAEDAGSGVAARSLGGGGTGKWSAWRPYTPRTTMTLEGRAGTKTVYVRYRDGAGNISSASDKIVYRP